MSDEDYDEVMRAAHNRQSTSCQNPQAPANFNAALNIEDVVKDNPVLPDELWLKICQSALDQINPGGVKTYSPALGRMTSYPDGAHPFPGLRASCYQMVSLCDSLRTSICYLLEDQQAVGAYLPSLKNLTSVIIQYYWGDVERQVRISLGYLHNLAPSLTQITLHSDKHQRPVFKLQACIGDKIMLWGASLQTLHLHNINLSASAKVKQKSPCSQGLMFLSHLPSLVELKLYGVAPAVSYEDLANCPGLHTLNVKGENLSTHPFSLDLTCCPQLLHLTCLSYNLGALKLQGLTALQDLCCSDNHLSDLDVSKCSALTSLRCAKNELIGLDVTSNHKLEVLVCNSNKIPELDLSSCLLIQTVNCRECTNISELSLITSQYLQVLICSDIVIDTEELHAICKNLTCLHLENNTSLKELNFADCIRLTELKVLGSSLTSLDVSECTALKHLNCGDSCQLTVLNTSGCCSLCKVHASGCNLESLDVSGCLLLSMLNCNGSCALQSLDLRFCISLKDVSCSGTCLVSLDLSSSAATLVKLNCSDSAKLEVLYMTGCSKLAVLDCAECLQLQHVDCRKCTSLTVLHSKNAGRFKHCIDAGEFRSLARRYSGT